MENVHAVEQGEHVTRIARLHGFGQWSRVWEEAGNAQIRAGRPNPHVLYPGDEVHVPARIDKQHGCQSSRRHRFRGEVQRVFLRAVVLDINSRPVQNTPLELQVDAPVLPTSTDSKGILELEISPVAESGRLALGTLEIPVQVGHLDPVEELSGYMARLNNLGYDAGDPAAVDSNQLQSAIEEFQCDNGLQVDGNCGPVTQARIKAVHGC